MKKLYPSYVVFLIQTLICFLAFKDLLLHPFELYFRGFGDSLKNYFTLQSYVNQDKHINWLHYNQMNYPYGDLILYTDNTPLLAIFIKFINTYVIDISGYTIPIFNWTVILNILLASFICVKIFKQLGVSSIVSIAASILIPWINPQTYRIGIGLGNLSYSFIPLFCIYLLIRINQAKDLRKQYMYLIILGCFSLMSMFVHAYYIFINAFTIAIFLIIWMISDWKRNKKRPKLLFASVLFAPLLLGISATIIYMLDPEINYRSTNVGYGWDEWKMRIDGLFVPYFHYKATPFLISANQYIPYEAHIYLGGFFLYTMLILILFSFIKELKTKYFLKNIFTSTTDLSTIFILTSIGVIFIAIGENINFWNNQYRFNNFLNPFFYIRKFYPYIQTIRCTGRFGWYAFFLLNIWLIKVVDHHINNNKSRFLKIILCVLFIIPTFEMKDNIEWIQQETKANTFSHLKKEEMLPSAVHTDQYAAIYPIPFYHVGSENAENVIETEEPFFEYNLKLSLATGLPLMSSRMSRTPEYQNQALVNLILKDSTDKTIHNKLNKPVLLVYSNQLNCDDCPIHSTSKTAVAFIKDSRKFPSNKMLKLIARTDQCSFYEWHIN